MNSEVRLFTAIFVALFALSSCNKENFTERLEVDNTRITQEITDESVNAFRFPGDGTGSVYVMDNDPGSNNVLVFNRRPNGTLNGPLKVATHGQGSGGGLGSQGSIVSDGEYVYACNAGSNTISVLRIVGKTLKFVDKTSSHGTMPISIAVHDNLIYVLNAGGTGNISGFKLGLGGLNHIPFSEQALSSSAAGPAQISFNAAGDQLVVTEKATNMITTYAVDGSGKAGAGTSYPSAGLTPFGFEFSPAGDLIVSEAFGGNENASTVSSYSLGAGGTVDLIDGPEATNQTAACWVVVTSNGEFAYASNTGSNSVTGYRIDDDGDLHLLNADGVTGVTGDGPIDMDMSPNSTFLYVLNARDNSISVLSRRYNGQLFPVQTITDLPDAVVGMAVE